MAACCGVDALSPNAPDSARDIAGAQVRGEVTPPRAVHSCLSPKKSPASMNTQAWLPELQAQLSEVMRQTIRSEFERMRADMARHEQQEKVRHAFGAGRSSKPGLSRHQLDLWAQSVKAADSQDGSMTEDVTLGEQQQTQPSYERQESGSAKEPMHMHKRVDRRQRTWQSQDGSINSPIRALVQQQQRGLQLPPAILRRAGTNGLAGLGGDPRLSASECTDDEVRIQMAEGQASTAITPSHCCITEGGSETLSRDRSEEEKAMKSQWQTHMRDQLGKNLRTMRTSGLSHTLSNVFGNRWFKHQRRPSKFEAEQKNGLENIVDSNMFHAVCGFIIVVNAIFIGYRTDLCMRNALAEPPRLDPEWMSKVDLMFVCFFMGEVLFRLVAKRLQFFLGPDFRWNCFDLFVLMFSFWEEVVHPFVYDGEKFSLTYVRLLGGLRMVRELRMMRIIRFFGQLRLMVCSVIQSLFSLTWALVLLFLIMYIFTITFMHAITVHLHLGGDGTKQEYHTYYGGVANTMFTLILAISGGADWENLVAPLSDISWWYTFLFSFYVLFVIMGVLNVLTSAFVQRACELSKLDSDLVIQSELASNESFVAEMHHIFEELDQDDAGRITWENFRKSLQKEKVQAYFATQQLDTTDARDLFCLLDMDGDDHVELEEFIMGCKRLRGQAKSSDVATLMQDGKRNNRKYTRSLRRIEQQVGAICGAIGAVDMTNMSFFGSPTSRAHSPARVRAVQSCY